MSIICDMIAAGGYKWVGWISIEDMPPKYLHVLVLIKNWGPAIGMLLEDNQTFRFMLPIETPHQCLEMDISHITHWHPVPELKEV